MPAPAFRYHAFISHRPEDNRAPGRCWADWLRHSIESFDVPPNVAGKRTPAGPAPSQLFPVFVPDGSEPASVIREAIDQSRVMIVICSPGAAQSAQVAEEIRHFKKSGRDRVIALIVAGEPNARSPKDECFPDTLKYEVTKEGEVDREWLLHPLGADARLDGIREGFTSPAALEASLENGRNLPPGEIRDEVAAYREKLEMALTRVLAGVLGVQPPEIAKRDRAVQAAAARGGGKVAWVMVIIFAAIAGAAGYFAWREYDRRQAVSEARNRADRLLGSLQHDIRLQLEPIGQLPLMADINERVTSHLTAAVRDNNDPKLFAALGTALDDAVHIHTARADYANALNAVQLTLQILEKAAKDEGASPENSLRRLKMLRRSSAIFLKLNQKPAAFTQADAARTLGGELIRTDPGNTEGALETIWAHYDAGDIMAPLGKTEEARTAFNAGRDVAARFAVKAPDNVSLQRALAEGHARLGELLQQSADFPAAMAEFRDAEKIMAPLFSKTPDDLAVQASFAFVHKRMAFTLALQNEVPAAIAQQRQVLDIFEKFAKRDPANKDFQFDRAEALRRLADMVLRGDSSNRTEAITLIQKGLDVLAEHFPGKTDGPAARLRMDLESLRTQAAQ